MEPGHKSKGFGRQKANLTCIWSSRWPGGSAAGKWTHALLGLILTCVSSTSTAASLLHYSVMPYTPPIKNQEVLERKTLIHMQPWEFFFIFYVFILLVSCTNGRNSQDKTIKTFKEVEKGKTWIESGKNNKNNKCIVKTPERGKTEKKVSPVRILFVHQLNMPTSNI